MVDIIIFMCVKIYGDSNKARSSDLLQCDQIPLGFLVRACVCFLRNSTRYQNSFTVEQITMV